MMTKSIATVLKAAKADFVDFLGSSISAPIMIKYDKRCSGGMER